MAKLVAHTYKPVFIVYKHEDTPFGRTTFFECVRSDRKILHRFTKYENGRMVDRQKYVIKGRMRVGIPFLHALVNYQMSGWFVDYTDKRLLEKE